EIPTRRLHLENVGRALGPSAMRPGSEAALLREWIPPEHWVEYRLSRPPWQMGKWPCPVRTGGQRRQEGSQGVPLEETESEKLRILIADHGTERVAAVTDAVIGLGHSVTPRARLEDVGQATIRERPDLAIVIVEESSTRAMRLIGSIVREATCPVIAILATQNREFVNEAAKRGIFAYIT